VGLRFLEEAEAALWSAEGERARAYLHGRGLNDETLRAWRIGFQP
jgi:DNA primase